MNFEGTNILRLEIFKVLDSAFKLISRSFTEC